MQALLGISGAHDARKDQQRGPSDLATSGFQSQVKQRQVNNRTLPHVKNAERSAAGLPRRCQLLHECILLQGLELEDDDGDVVGARFMLQPQACGLRHDTQAGLLGVIISGNLQRKGSRVAERDRQEVRRCTRCCCWRQA